MEVQRLELLHTVKTLGDKIKFLLLILVEQRTISQNISNRSFNNWQIQINNSLVNLNQIEMKTTEMELHLSIEI